MLTLVTKFSDLSLETSPEVWEIGRVGESQNLVHFLKRETTGESKEHIHCAGISHRVESSNFLHAQATGNQFVD